jgi:hypothetical protein
MADGLRDLMAAFVAVDHLLAEPAYADDAARMPQVSLPAAIAVQATGCRTLVRCAVGIVTQCCSPLT